MLALLPHRRKEGRKEVGELSAGGPEHLPLRNVPKGYSPSPHLPFPVYPSIVPTPPTIPVHRKARTPDLPTTDQVGKPDPLNLQQDQDTRFPHLRTSRKPDQADQDTRAQYPRAGGAPADLVHKQAGHQNLLPQGR